MRGRRAAERNDLRVAAAVHRRRHERQHDADVDVVEQAVRRVDRVDVDVDVHVELELHDVILEQRNAHQLAAPALNRIAAREVDVLVGEEQIDVVQVTPRSDEKCDELRPMPTAVRPRPSVCARSAKIGPADGDVRTGTPASKRKLSPPLVDPIGALETLPAIAVVRNEMIDPFCVTADGTKCVPCAWIDAGLFGSADPARKSGSSPDPKMNS